MLLEGEGRDPLGGRREFRAGIRGLGHAVDRMINKIHMFNVKPQCLNPKH